MTDQGSEGANELIAANYDAVPYDPPEDRRLAVARIRGLAAIFGPVRPFNDVLDIGCGTGVQLKSVSDDVLGRLVGTDISREACRLASDRLTALGPRAEVRCEDILQCDLRAFGSFDLIYNVGVIYVTPPEVRRQILSIIGASLRPGGAAVISYYAGAIPTLRAKLHQTLRAITQNAPSRAEAVAMARRELDAIAATLTNDSMVKTAVDQTRNASDVVFFHEVLNNTFDPIMTSDVAAALGRDGLQFASYLQPSGTGTEPEAFHRAINADVIDLRLGGYRYAVFVKPEDGRDTKPDVTSSVIEWHSDLCRDNPGEFNGSATFRERSGANTVTAPTPPTQAILDAFSGGPMSWDAALRDARATLGVRGIPIGEEAAASAAKDFQILWSLGLVTPVA